MKVLIVGGGGREHALAWKIGQSREVSKVYVAPGNAGTALEPKIENVAIAAEDIPKLAAFAADQKIDLTVVGPEAPLVAGIVDHFSANNLACFGPTQAAARLEGSKAFCKDFLRRHHIPTASYETFTDLDAALAYLDGQEFPLVIKADGLAAGKGVIIAQNQEEAVAAVTDMLRDEAFGSAGKRVVIEEFLQGEEASFMVMADGETFLSLATSQDHKPLEDGDRGPNTGGMGAYSPAPMVTPELHERILNQVIRPTLEGLANEGIAYRGFLYAGLMISPAGEPKVLEFNCRMGDPETQPILMRLQSDLAILSYQAVRQGGLKGQSLAWDRRTALGVVLAAQGYPAAYRRGDVIEGLPTEIRDDLKVFHAGTALVDDKVVTSGGRVLCVCALGEGVADAQRKAYELVAKIHWPGMVYRKDIGWRAIAGVAED